MAQNRRWHGTNHNAVAPPLADYDILKHGVTELIEAGVNLSPSVQTYLAERVSGTYRQAYNSWSSRHPDGGTFEEFFKTSNSSSDAVRQQVRSAPLDFSMARHMFPDLADVHNVGDAQQLLVRSMIPGILSSASDYATSEKQNFADLVGPGTEGVYDAMWQFQSQAVNKRGEIYNRSFANFAMEQSGFAMKNAIRAEKDIRGGAVGIGNNEGGSEIIGGGNTNAPIMPAWPDDYQTQTIQPSRSFVLDFFHGLKTPQERLDYADAAESGHPFLMASADSGGIVQGTYHPMPEEVAKGPEWYERIADNFGDDAVPTNMISWNGQATRANGDTGPSLVGTASSGNRQVRLTAQDVLNFGEMIQPGGYFDLESINSPSLRATRKEQRDILRREINNADKQLRGVGDLSDPSLGFTGNLDELDNYYATQERLPLRSSQTEIAARMGEERFKTNLFSPTGQATVNGPNPIPMQLSLSPEDGKPVTLTSQDVLNYGQMVSSGGYFDLTGIDDPGDRSQYSAQRNLLGGAIHTIHTNIRARRPAPDLYHPDYDTLPPPSDFIDIDPSKVGAYAATRWDTERIQNEQQDSLYSAAISSIPQDSPLARLSKRIFTTGSTATPISAVMTAGELARGTRDWNELRAVESERTRLQKTLGQLSPEDAARIRYAGADEEAFASKVYDVVGDWNENAWYEPGHAAEWGAKFERFAPKNFELANQLREIFPSETEQRNLANDLILSQEHQTMNPVTAMPDMPDMPDNPADGLTRSAPPRRRKSNQVTLPGNDHAQAWQPARMGGDPTQDPGDNRRPLRNVEDLAPMLPNARAQSNNGGGGGPPNYNSTDYFNWLMEDMGAASGGGSGAGNNGGNGGNGNVPPPPDGRDYSQYYPDGGQDPSRITPMRAENEGTPASRRAALQALGPMASQRVSVGSVDGYNNRLFGQAVSNDLGSGEVERSVMYNPHAMQVPGDNGRTLLQHSGRVMQDEGQLGVAAGIAQRAVAGSTLGALPEATEDRAATIKQRIFDSIDKDVKGITEDMTKSGMGAEEAQGVGKMVRNIAQYMTKAAFANIKESLGASAEDGDTTGSNAFNDIKSGSVYVKKGEAARNVYNSSASVRQKIDDMGVTPEELAESDERTILTDDDAHLSYSFGKNPAYDNSGGQNFRGGGNGIFKGGLGSAMYGAFMMKRMWSMAAGPMMDEAAKYGEYASTLGPLSYYGDPSGQGDLINTDAGYTARQTATENYLGRGAYQEFGGFTETGYALSGGGDSASRMIASAKMAGSVAGTGIIAGGILGMMPEAMGLGALAGAAPTIGLAAGVGVLAVGLGYEVANAVNPNAEIPYTPGNTWRGIVRDSVEASARGKLGGENENYANKLGQGTDYTSEQLQSVMTRQERAIYNYKGETPEQKKIMDMAGAMGEATGEDKASTAAAMKSIFKALGGKVSDDIGEKFGYEAVAAGRSTAQYANEAMGYAEQMGFTPETQGYVDAFMQYGATTSEAGRFDLNARAQRNSQLGSQLSGYLDAPSLGPQLTRENRITTQPMAGNAQRFLATASQFQTTPVDGLKGDGLAYINNRPGDTAQQLVAASQKDNPYVSGAISQMANLVGQAGGDAQGFMTTLSGVGMSNQQATLAGQIFGGDLQAASYASWQNGDMKYRLFDQSGNSMNETNGGSMMETMQSWSGLSSLSGMSPALFGHPEAMASSLLGTDNQGYINAYIEGGTRGMGALHAQNQYGFQMASIGIQGAGIALQENYLWGSDTATDPAANSAWGMQDRMTQMQYQAQEGDFAYQKQQAETSNRYAIKREENQWSRMQTSNAYNNWQQDFSYQNSLQQRSWTQQDWQTQDQRTEMNFGWQMEDVNKEIRYSSGRQRRDLIEQRDRMTTTHNLDEEQVDTTRKRQEQLWSQEDERFTKQKSYNGELQKLDAESFKLNQSQREQSYKDEMDNFNRKKKEYEEQKKLQDEMTKLSREYQVEQIELQKASLGVQAAAAKDNEDYNLSITNTTNTVGDFVGEIQKLNSYDNAFRVAMGLRELAGMLGTMKTDGMKEMGGMITKLNSIDTGKIYALIRLMEEEYGH